MTAQATPSSLAAPERLADLQVGISMAVVGFYVASMGAMLAVLATEFEVAPESLSWVGSTFGAGLLVVAAAGRLLLRGGARLALAGSAVTLGLGTLLVALAPHLGFVFAGAALQGLGAAVMVLVAPVMLARNADVRLTRVNGVASLVGIAAPLLVGAVVGVGGSGRLAILLLTPGLAWLLWTLAKSGADRPVAAPVGSSGNTRPRAAAVLRRWLAVVMAVAVEFCYVVWGVSRLRDTGLDTSIAAIAGIAFPVGMAVGRLAGPWLIRRLPAVPFGVVISALGSLLVVLGSEWPMVASGLVLAGLGVATLYPVTLAELMAVPGLRPAVGASLGALASASAILLAPTALAGLATAVELRLSFLVALPLLGLLLLLRGRTREPARVGAGPATGRAS